jgi:hypothetical protein
VSPHVVEERFGERVDQRVIVIGARGIRSRSVPFGTVGWLIGW